MAAAAAAPSISQQLPHNMSWSIAEGACTANAGRGRVGQCPLLVVVGAVLRPAVCTPDSRCVCNQAIAQHETCKQAETELL